jgi:hypothetical protein
MLENKTFLVYVYVLCKLSEFQTAVVH